MSNIKYETMNTLTQYIIKDDVNIHEYEIYYKYIINKDYHKLYTTNVMR